MVISAQHCACTHRCEFPQNKSDEYFGVDGVEIRFSWFALHIHSPRFSRKDIKQLENCAYLFSRVRRKDTISSGVGNSHSSNRHQTPDHVPVTRELQSAEKIER